MTSKINTWRDFSAFQYRKPHSYIKDFQTDAGDVIDIQVLANDYVESGFDCSGTYWVEVWRIVWSEYHGELYAYDYAIPSTELQDGVGEEFDPSDIYQVKGRTVETIVYERVR